MRSDVDFERKLRIGNMGERLVSKLLQSWGAGVIPSYAYCGQGEAEKAPRLMFNAKSLVIPDLDVCGGGTRAWIEVKTYHGPAQNHIHRCKVHGIQRRLAEQYARVESETGTPAFVGVLELDSRELLVSALKDLQPILWSCQCGPCRAGREDCCSAFIKRAVYWPRDAYGENWGGMDHWHTFSAAEIAPICAAKAA